jgi:glycosyl transferase family 2
MKLIYKIIFINFYYILLLSFLYFIITGYPFWKGAAIWIWNQLHYNYTKYGFLMFIIGDIIINYIPYVLFRRTNKEIIQISDEIALIIPCHKAEQIIKKTLECAIKVFNNLDIYVIDNGNSTNPSDNTKEICDEMGINYYYIPIGSKTKAIYFGLKLTYNYKYIMQIDDDIYLQENMTFPINEHTHCIAYTIGACINNNKNIEYFQDIEYKYSGLAKAYKSYFGSDMFAHGAISLWNREVFIKVLENHPMYKISDDWFNGLILNQMGYKMEVVDKDFILTDVPTYYFKSNGRTTGYGTMTLFDQRCNRWYKSQFLQLYYILYYILFNWNNKFKILIIQKIFFLLDILRYIFNMAKFLLIGIYIDLNYQLALIMISIYLLYTYINLLTFNYYILQKKERIPLYIYLLYPFYILYDGLICVISTIYAIILATPIIVITKQDNIKNDFKLNNIINNYLNLQNNNEYGIMLTPTNN